MNEKGRNEMNEKGRNEMNEKGRKRVRVASRGSDTDPSPPHPTHKKTRFALEDTSAANDAVSSDPVFRRRAQSHIPYRIPKSKRNFILRDFEKSPPKGSRRPRKDRRRPHHLLQMYRKRSVKSGKRLESFLESPPQFLKPVTWTSQKTVPNNLSRGLEDDNFEGRKTTTQYIASNSTLKVLEPYNMLAEASSSIAELHTLRSFSIPVMQPHPYSALQFVHHRYKLPLLDIPVRQTSQFYLTAANLQGSRQPNQPNNVVGRGCTCTHVSSREASGGVLLSYNVELPGTYFTESGIRMQWQEDNEKFNFVFGTVGENEGRRDHLFYQNAQNCSNVSSETSIQSPAYVPYLCLQLKRSDLYRLQGDFGRKESCSSILRDKFISTGDLCGDDKLFDEDNSLCVPLLPTNWKEGEDMDGRIDNEEITKVWVQAFLDKHSALYNVYDIRLVKARVELPVFWSMTAGTYNMAWSFVQKPLCGVNTPTSGAFNYDSPVTSQQSFRGSSAVSPSMIALTVNLATARGCHANECSGNGVCRVYTQDSAPPYSLTFWCNCASGYTGEFCDRSIIGLYELSRQEDYNIVSNDYKRQLVAWKWLTYSNLAVILPLAYCISLFVTAIATRKLISNRIKSGNCNNNGIEADRIKSGNCNNNGIEADSSDNSESSRSKRLSTPINRCCYKCSNTSGISLFRMSTASSDMTHICSCSDCCANTIHDTANTIHDTHTANTIRSVHTAVRKTCDSPFPYLCLNDNCATTVSTAGTIATVHVLNERAEDCKAKSDRPNVMCLNHWRKDYEVMILVAIVGMALTLSGLASFLYHLCDSHKYCLFVDNSAPYDLLTNSHCADSPDWQRAYDLLVVTTAQNDFGDNKSEERKYIRYHRRNRSTTCYIRATRVLGEIDHRRTEWRKQTKESGEIISHFVTVYTPDSHMIRGTSQPIITASSPKLNQTNYGTKYQWWKDYFKSLWTTQYRDYAFGWLQVLDFLFAFLAISFIVILIGQMTFGLTMFLIMGTFAIIGFACLFFSVTDPRVALSVLALNISILILGFVLWLLEDTRHMKNSLLEIQSLLIEAVEGSLNSGEEWAGVHRIRKPTWPSVDCLTPRNTTVSTMPTLEMIELLTADKFGENDILSADKFGIGENLEGKENAHMINCMIPVRHTKIHSTSQRKVQNPVFLFQCKHSKGEELEPQCEDLYMNLTAASSKSQFVFVYLFHRFKIWSSNYSSPKSLILGQIIFVMGCVCWAYGMKDEKAYYIYHSLWHIVVYTCTLCLLWGVIGNPIVLPPRECFAPNP